MRTLLSSMKELFGAENVLCSGTDLLAAAFNPASLRNGFENSLPLAVLRPAHLSQIPKLIGFCKENGLSVRPRAGNTGWYSRPVSGKTIILDMGSLNRILEFNPIAGIIRAQAGASCASLQSYAAARGFLLPGLLPGAASVGGWLACNEWGAESAFYGPPSNRVISLRVWDGTGRECVCQSQNSAAAHLDGFFPLANLFCGSRGELGIVGEATLSLLPMPEICARIAALFDSPSDLAAMQLELMEKKIRPNAAFICNPNCLRELGKPEKWLLALEFQTAACVMKSLVEQAELCAHTHKGLIISGESLDYADWLASLPVILSARVKKWRAESVGCLPERMGALLENIDALSRQYQLPCLVFGPAFSGRLQILADGDNENGQAFFHDLFVLDLVLNGCLESDSDFPSDREQWRETRAQASADKNLREIFDPDHVLNQSARAHF